MIFKHPSKPVPGTYTNPVICETAGCRLASGAD